LSIQGATATITAGAVTAAVAGSFPATYQVAISASWVTDFDVVSKTAAGFTVNFSVPAPLGGGSMDWIVSDSSTTTSQAITSATQTVTAAGSVTEAVTVAASLPGSYQVSVVPSWVTSVDVVSKTAAGFVVNFGVPAPLGTSTFDYIVYGPAIGTVSLSDYLDELRDLLHDPMDRLWSQTQKANYINRARRERDMATAINRSTITFTLTAGTASYTFATVGNGQIFDVFSIFLQQGQTRIALGCMSLSDLVTSGLRMSINFTGWTMAFARQGESTVIFAPTPSQAYVTEWDCAVYLAPLVNLTDTDSLAYPYVKPVAYYAANLAKINQRRWDEAQEFKDEYERLVGSAVNDRAPRVPNYYSGLGTPAGWRGY